jgi:peptidoglycan/LPS O-acetylase OafA/YrhL
MFSNTKYRRDIQVFRGLAVLAVVLFHADESSFRLGYLGVDVFFVISGFIVTPLILQIFTDQENRGGRLSNLRYFYKRRFYRLAPALAAALTISGVAIYLLGPTADHQRVAIQGIATLLFVGNVGAYRYSGDYFSPNPNPLVHTWSLSVEEQIYVLLPLVLMVCLHNRRRIKEFTTVVLGCIFIISFVSFVFPAILQPIYSLAGIQLASQFSFYSPIDRIWQFTMGGLGHLLLNQYQSHNWRISKRINTIITIAIMVLLFGPIHMSLKVSSICISLLSIIAIMFKSLEALPGRIMNKLEWVGDRSYSIYLFHMPLLYVALYSPVVKIGYDENRTFQVTIAVLASLLLGALSYSKIENRFRNRGEIHSPTMKTIVASMALTLLVPLSTFVILDRSTAFPVKNSGLPVPNQELPWDWDKNCQFFSPQRYINFLPCKYGNNNSGKTILLIGDSHAASASRAVISLGSSNDMDTFVFTFEGCGFVLSKKDFKPSYSYPYLNSKCLKHNELIMNFVKNRKPTVVIYAQRSSSIMISPNSLESRTHYNEMVAENLEILIKENLEVIHIGSGPELLPIETRIEEWMNSKSEFSVIPFEDNAFWEYNRISDYYLNTLDIFCPRKICNNNSPNGWLFQDTNHLSELGAKRLIPGLDSMIKEILSRES